jgi:hypothetical protein
MRAASLTIVRGCFLLGVAALSLTGPAWPRDNGAAPSPHPDDGTVIDGIYVSPYFDLSYPLPPGWKTGMAGPGPSHAGYYVLSTLIPAGDQRGIISISAQDMFFAAGAARDEAAAAVEIGRAMSAIEGMTVDRPPSEATIAGRRFSRIDFSGVGLFRSTLITQIRCHLVSFNITANNRDLLAALVLSFDKLGRASERSPRDVDPACRAIQAPTEHLLTRVDPPAIAPFMPIPVRIVIDGGGNVKRVHVIRGTTDQRTAIEAALRQWKFKPPVLSGSAAELESGLLVEFTPMGAVKYLAGDRALPF